MIQRAWFGANACADRMERHIAGKQWKDGFISSILYGLCAHDTGGPNQEHTVRWYVVGIPANQLA